MSDENLKNTGLASGLLVLGIVQLESEPGFSHFDQWINDDLPEYLVYLNSYREIRRDPRLLMDGAATAIICAVQYELSRDKANPQIAGYAMAADYHRLMKKRMNHFVTSLTATDPRFHEAQFRVVVDSAPVLERAMAARTAEGFIGKNTCYIHPKWGSNLLLGEIITSAKLVPDNKNTIALDQRTKDGGCGTCRRCQVHCPTDALSSDYKINANRCLSYWSIENRGVVPLEYWHYFGAFWYGCDICQNVCPYNRQTSLAGNAKLERRQFDKLDLAEVVMMDQHYYERVFSGTPMVRAKIDGLRRNALIALAARGDERLDALIGRLKEVPQPLVITETIEQVADYRLSK